MQLELSAQRKRINDMAGLSNDAYDCFTPNPPKDSRVKCYRVDVSDFIPNYKAVYLIRTDEVTHEQVVAIRGSHILDDWLTDGAIVRIPDSYLGRQIPSHLGFQKVAHAVYKDIAERAQPLIDAKRNRITTTGHSLGGAAALLLGLYLYSADDSDYRISGVYTFGQPKVFGNEGATAWPFFSRRVVRVINCDDLVPIVPTADVEINKPFHVYNHRLDDYQHLGQSVLLMNNTGVWMSGDIDFERSLVSNALNWLRALAQRNDVGHQMPQYVARLEHLAEARPVPPSVSNLCGASASPNVASIR